MPEPEMWYILRALTGGAISLRSKGLYHGDIQPRHVLVNPEGNIKLIEAPLINQYFTGYNRMTLERDYHAALSPEQMDILRLRRADVRKGYNEKDEVYSIGITSLCAATNNPITAFYDYQSLSVNQAMINQALGNMEELGYSEELIDTVAGMLHQDPGVRSTLDMVDEIANHPHEHYDDDIDVPEFRRSIITGDQNAYKATRNDFVIPEFHQQHQPIVVPPMKSPNESLIHQYSPSNYSRNPILTQGTPQKPYDQPIIIRKERPPQMTHNTTYTNMRNTSYISEIASPHKQGERTYTYQKRPQLPSTYNQQPVIRRYTAEQFQQPSYAHQNSNKSSARKY